MIVPTGQPLWDRGIWEHYRQSSSTARFLEIWEILGSDDPDALSYHLRKDPTKLPELIRKVGYTLYTSRVSRLIVSGEDTPFLRSVVLVARQLGVTVTQVVNPALMENDSQLQLPESMVNHLLAVAQPEFLSSSLLRRTEKFSSDDLRLRAILGCSSNDHVVLILGPTIQASRTDEYMRLIFEQSWRNAIQGITSKTHLVVALKSKKGGYLPPGIHEELKAIYRKTVVTYEENAPLQNLVLAADQIICSDPAEEIMVRGLLGEDWSLQEESFLSEESANISPGYAPLKGRPGLEFLNRQLATVDAIHQGSSFEVVAVPDPLSNKEITDGRQRYLPNLIGFTQRIYGAGAISEAAQAEFFLQWGAEPSESKERVEIARAAFGRPKLFVEDGFVRSLGLWTDPNEPTCSVQFDTDAIYYDATVPTLLEKILSSECKLTEDEMTRARRQIERIVTSKISKYNYAPVIEMPKGERRRVLIVDQKAGDMSIRYGRASSESFFEMIEDAKLLPNDVDILIKQHPCAITNGEHEAHFTRGKLGEFATAANVQLLSFDINPFSLFEAVDEVWVVSSGMGFEALLAGKTVRTYGAPFYAGWGFTDDVLNHERRTRSRSVEEVFYVFYNWLTRYADPRTHNVCDLETLLDYIEKNRPLHAQTNG